MMMVIDLLLKPDPRRLTWATGLTGILFAVATFFCSLHHEPWLDEVQSWILAQSANSSYIIFEHPHWRAHPTLWDLILKVFSIFFENEGLALAALILAWIFAVQIIFFSELSLFLRIGFVFSYFFFYQYPIVARNYILYPILFWIILSMWDQRRNRPYLFGFILALIASVSVHGMILIPALLLVDLFYSSKQKENSEDFWKSMIPYGIGGLASVFWFTCIWPNYQPIPKALNANVGLFYLKELSKMLCPNSWISLLAFAASGYLMLKKRIFILFIVPIIVWALFFFTIYFAAWHEGIVYSWWAICVMKSLDIVVTWVEWKRKVAFVLLLLVFSFQFKWSWSAWFNDLRGPYCGAEALAAEIKKNQWDKKRINGYGELTSTLNFYFSHNIFQNSWKPENRFYSWNQEKDLAFPDDGIIQGNPDFIIAHQFDSKIPAKVFPQYRCIGRFIGHMYWKDRIGDGSFDLYRKE